MTQKFGLLFGAAAMVATSFALPVPAVAQGTVGPVPKNGMCPSGWNDGPYVRGTPSKTCYPNSSSSKAIYVRSGACASGYGADGNYCVKGASSGMAAPTATARVAKSVPGDRCPVTFYSEPDMKSCFSISTKPPATRLKGNAPCRAGELEEWGKWCTANTAIVTEYDAHQASYRDVVTIFNATGKVPIQGDEVHKTPSILALFGGASAASSSSSDSATSSGSTQVQAQPNCSQQGSAEGAALGGAVAGETGAAIGAMLGGFGKKKKPAGC